MYYYISFLRPPPLQCALNTPIIITPQVSNDLRTKPYESPLDIFYFWTSPHAARPHPVPITKPVKLTAWRNANAYKELSVPSPPRLKNGDRCCLVLTAHSNATMDIDLTQPGRGKGIRSGVLAAPLPVSSLPITFAARLPGGKQRKQESILRSFRLFDAQKEDAEVNENTLTIKEQTSFDLDKKLWDSGLGLSAWLVELSNGTTSTTEEDSLIRQLRTVLIEKEDCDIIELGAGTGIVSLVLAALRSRSSQSETRKKTRIISTDLPSSMELMNHNISQNMSLFPVCPPQALPLDWDEDLPTEVVEVGGFDLIVMADVTYNTSSFPSLVKTLSRLLSFPSASSPTFPNDTVREPPLVLLAYKQRDPAERDLWNMVEKNTGMKLVRIGGESGAGGEEVEIWMGEGMRR